VFGGGGTELRVRVPYVKGIRLLGTVWLHSLRDEGVQFAVLWPRLHESVPGWLNLGDARWLYALAHHGPGAGAIVEIGSAWGRSTICLASGSKRARRERVYAIDPHTGEPDFLTDPQRAFIPARWNVPLVSNLLGAAPIPVVGPDFSSLDLFQANLRRFGVADWVIPLVCTSHDAASHFDGGPIRMLFVDGLHAYEAVKTDIEDWVPRVIRGGFIVFDDYYPLGEHAGVQKAVDELVATGAVEPVRRGLGLTHVWTRKR